MPATHGRSMTRCWPLNKAEPNGPDLPELHFLGNVLNCSAIPQETCRVMLRRNGTKEEPSHIPSEPVKHDGQIATNPGCLNPSSTTAAIPCIRRRPPPNFEVSFPRPGTGWHPPCAGLPCPAEPAHRRDLDIERRRVAQTTPARPDPAPTGATGVDRHRLRPPATPGPGGGTGAAARPRRHDCRL